MAQGLYEKKLLRLTKGTAHLAGLLPAVLASEDAQEGVRSFLERREAKFTGR